VLIEVFADPAIMVQSYDEKGALVDRAADKRGYPPPALIPRKWMKPLDTLVAQMWPGLKVIPPCRQALPTVFTRARRGCQRITIAGVATDKDNIRAHGRDEKHLD